MVPVPTPSGADPSEVQEPNPWGSQMPEDGGMKDFYIRHNLGIIEVMVLGRYA